MIQKNGDHNSSFSEPEEYFNEITRDFILHEDMTNVIAKIPEISVVTNLTQLSDISNTTKISEFPEILEKPQSQKEKQTSKIPSIEISKKIKSFIFIGTLFSLLFISALTITKKWQSTSSFETQDPWQMDLRRAYFDFFPKYQDWTEVEKEYENAIPSEK